MINWRRFIILGLAIGFLFLALDVAIGVITAPLVGPHMDGMVLKKSVDSRAGLIFNLINGFILVGIFMGICKALPEKKLDRGLAFAVIVWFLRVVMMTFTLWVVYNIPLILHPLSLVTGLIEVSILGVVISYSFDRL